MIFALKIDDVERGGLVSSIRPDFMYNVVQERGIKAEFPSQEVYVKKKEHYAHDFDEIDYDEIDFFICFLTAMRSLSVYLQSHNEGLCRFTVKNEAKVCNRVQLLSCSPLTPQSLEYVQTQGYVEYKARYARRGVRYGSFHVAFLPKNKYTD